MMRNVQLMILLLGVLLGTSSCQDNRTFNSYYNINNDQWHQDSIVVFSPNVTSVDQALDLDVNIRNTNSYDFNNLWLFIKTTTPSGVVFNDTIDVPMADHRGRWLGRGLGNTFELSYPFKTNTLLPDTGTYHIEIMQGMRSEAKYIDGISDIGLRIDLTEYKGGKE
ncbi:gliding motility lipoprotein GldH [Halosquirtibacter xylanolyticus]|uniref:gliding motility lipoprotein GldH n=1 Tax=Halosquirtibacter xylanolyticus TaxID=3374599 RepID=UPI00374A92E2|nr:gliding motility lipoprotein GldH [Prolixibacteraceae bacterium]